MRELLQGRTAMTGMYADRREAAEAVVAAAVELVMISAAVIETVEVPEAGRRTGIGTEIGIETGTGDRPHAPRKGYGVVILLFGTLLTLCNLEGF